MPFLLLGADSRAGREDTKLHPAGGAPSRRRALRHDLRPGVSILYNLLYLLAAAITWPYLVWRRLKRGPGSLSWSERLGGVSSRPVAAHCAWIHGVSLGEINATQPLVAELRARSPETVIVISSTTQTGLQRAQELYPRLLVFRFPLDLSFVLHRVFQRIRPSIIVLMELEVWPNLLEVARSWHVPVIIANARITDERTMRAFRLPILRGIARRMFRQIAWVGAQDDVYARRFAELGVSQDRIRVTGSVKYDSAVVADRVDGQEAVAEQMAIDSAAPLWVCGSTGPGEEATILAAHAHLLQEFPQLQLVIVPRRPERFDEVARLIVEHNWTCLRRSGAPPLVPANVETPRAVGLGDTVGELRKFYALATVVFVGRSLVPMGGSDVMEVAGLGKPMVVGPHTENFAEPVEWLVRAGACQALSPDEANVDGLAKAIATWLRDTDRVSRGAAGREVVLSRRGATDRTVTQILTMRSDE